jgi:energy-coupling factor transport system substrate-specific component
MTWQLASMACVLLALGAGFAWYERGRPSSKLVALVAVLAALAVAGRIVFVDLVPNVQATTDIVLLVGYALGAGPGFAVGALAALASNFFLGQGPWTPWQMLGWGTVGVLGAALARLRATRRTRGEDAGRWSLALVCALAGLAFGAWMDLFLLLNFAAERTLDSYLALSATSLPFNVAHAVGNALLYLVFGPGFVRMLLRFRRRFEIDWGPASPRTAVISAGPVVLAILLSALPLAAAAPRADAAGGVRAAVRYIERAQNTDGGFGPAPGQRSSQLISGWAVIGLEAGGRHPLEVRRAGRTPVDFIRAHARTLSDTGEVERTILVLRGAGLDPRRFAGRDLVQQLLAARHTDGSFAGRVNITAFGVLALRAAGRSARSRAITRAARWLARQRNSDGGYSFARRGGTSDSDDTGAVLQALAAADRRRSRPVRRAVSWLRRAQNSDGGFGQFSRSPSNAQSTAWAAQGLVAARLNPSRFRHGATRSPLAYLSSLQQSDGSFRYSRTSAQTPVWVTAQVIAALRQKALPIRAIHR